MADRSSRRLQLTEAIVWYLIFLKIGDEQILAKQGNDSLVLHWIGFLMLDITYIMQFNVVISHERLDTCLSMELR